jgi:hypothetical protein
MSSSRDWSVKVSCRKGNTVAEAQTLYDNSNPRLAAARYSKQGSFLQLVSTVVAGKIDPQLTLFSDEASFHLQEHINTNATGVHRIHNEPTKSRSIQ